MLQDSLTKHGIMSSNGLETTDIPNDVYNALCEVDEAVTNLIDKIGEATKIITLSSIYKNA